MEKFIVCLKRNGLFQFKLVNEQEQTLLASLSYTHKQTCLNDIEMLRSGFDFTNRYFVTEVAANKFCFALLKSDIELLAVSKEFTSESDCENYIKRMQETVSGMIIDEQIH
ncbi:hypothetical protein ESA94_11135 [Lacibacter luteus]|uniref:DUF1508 domain-containing protein n=1 Tax=Lacibacter luteus TaxID=2508719 RepID=A0A4Q1CH39_9BACT|nr:hypothetical protein [Lacibacter luteus]RXK59618.1 hypothetical protein ESA94_11135 [Lacibacter luteus]